MKKKRFLHIIWMISIFFTSCVKSTDNNYDYNPHAYYVYDLSYNNTLYVGVCQKIIDDINNPYYIVYEDKNVKDYYNKFGIDSLIHKYTEIEHIMYHYHTKWNDNTPKLHLPFSDNDTTQRYIIYLAIKNNYTVEQDDESGFLVFYDSNGNHL